MPTSVAARAALEQLETFRGTLDEIRATADGPLVGANVLAAQCVVRAIDTAGMPRKEFVYHCDSKPSQAYSALNGAGSLPIGWLWAQPSVFWQAYWPLVAKAKLEIPEARKVAMRHAIDALQVFALLPQEERER